jgi:hypothetical protein
VIRLFDDGLGGKQGVAKDEICQVGMVQRDGSQKQRLLLGRIRRDSRLLSSMALLGITAYPSLVYTLCTHSNRTKVDGGRMPRLTEFPYVPPLQQGLDHGWPVCRR